MEVIFTSVLGDPVFYIGAVLAGIGALGFVIFASGFFPGIAPALKETGNAEHVFHQRTRAAQGFYLMLFAFLLWEIVRWLAGV